MSHENHEPDSLDAMERSLSRFSAAPPQIDRDRLMFLAGRASASGTEHQDTVYHSGDSEQHRVRRRERRGVWPWPASTAVLAATSLSLALTLAFQPAQPPMIVYRDPPAPPPTALPEQPSEPAPPIPLATAASHRDRDRDRPESGSSYLKTREVALRMGLDALGSPAYSSESAGPTSYHDLWLRWTSTPAASDKPQRQSSM